MNWIDREVDLPTSDKILVYADKEVFICKLFESKWGNFYYSTDWYHEEYQNMPDWTHWMPLPNPPIKENV